MILREIAARFICQIQAYSRKAEIKPLTLVLQHYFKKESLT
jgi:hypothetical protein